MKDIDGIRKEVKEYIDEIRNMCHAMEYAVDHYYNNPFWISEMKENLEYMSKYSKDTQNEIIILENQPEENLEKKEIKSSNNIKARQMLQKFNAIITPQHSYSQYKYGYIFVGELSKENTYKKYVTFVDEKTNENKSKPVLIMEAPIKEGKINGVVREFEPDGSLLYETKYVNDQKHGIEKSYSNGNLYEKELFVKGQTVGLYSKADKDEDILSNFYNKKFKKKELEIEDDERER